MIPEFSVFVGNRVLAWLLSHPSSAPGINELAREAGVSPASAKQYVDIFVRDGIIRKRKAGTAHLVSLNNEYVLVREMKRTFLVARLLEAGVAEGIGEGTETGWIDESGRDAEPDVSTESGVLEGSPPPLSGLPWYRTGGASRLLSTAAEPVGRMMKKVTLTSLLSGGRSHASAMMQFRR
ncbi:hypothetical protein [Methanogenium cariaci]|uniref:hypothetical protein n=1 Tax=Methanogenium cariaci TaxID=2197 RepID=UPI000785EE37|nr:hypothetical protein [Methanogenium cariaci]